MECTPLFLNLFVVLRNSDLVPDRSNLKTDSAQGSCQFLGKTAASQHRIESRLIKHEVLIGRSAQLFQPTCSASLAAKIRLLANMRNTANQDTLVGCARRL